MTVDSGLLVNGTDSALQVDSAGYGLLVGSDSPPIADLTFYCRNDDTIDAGSGIDVRRLNPVAGAADSTQTISVAHTVDTQWRIYDPASVATDNAQADTLVRKGWAVSLADLVPGDSRCKVIIPAQSITMTVLVSAAWTGVPVGAIPVTGSLAGASLFRYNPATDVGSSLVYNTNAAGVNWTSIENGTEKSFSFTLNIPQSILERDEVLFLQLATWTGTLANPLTGTSTYTFTLRIGDATGTRLVLASKLQKRCAETGVGSATPTGVVIRKPTRGVVGTVSPTSEIVRYPRRHLVGTATPVGTVAKTPQRYFTGTATPAGEVAKTPTRIIAGSVTPGPSQLIFTPRKVLVGTVSPTSEIVRYPRRHLTRDVIPSGDVFKTPRRHFTGEFSGSGEIIRTPVKVLTATVTPGPGDLRSLITKNLRADVPTSGDLTKTAARYFTGTVTPQGDVKRSPKKFLTGVIGPESGGGTTVIIRPIRIFED